MYSRVYVIILCTFALAACSLDVSLRPGGQHGDGSSSESVVMGKGPGVCVDNESQLLPLDRDQVLIWGDYSQIGACGASAKILDLKTGKSLPTADVVGAWDSTSIPDGQGGWYMANWHKIVHVLADGTVDPAFVAFRNSTAEFAGNVKDMKLAHGRLYVAGEIHKRMNPNGGPTDLLTGNSIYPSSLSGRDLFGGRSVQAVVSDGGSGFYLSGEFGQYRGAPVSSLIHVDVNGALISSFKPVISGAVRRLLYNKDSKVLYLAGDFWAVNGKFRSGLAAIDTTTGSVLNWAPLVSYSFSWRDVAVSEAHGLFFIAGYGDDEKIAAVDLASGLIVQTYEVGPASGQVRTLHVLNDYLYIGGRFSSLQGVGRNNAGAIDLSNGTVASWNPDPSSDVEDISSAPEGNEVFLAGYFYTIGGVDRVKLGSVHPITAALSSFNPGASFTGGDIYQVAVNSATVYVSGNMNTPGGRVQYAAFNRATNAVLPWQPRRQPDAIYSSGGQLALGSASIFVLARSVGEEPRGGLLALDAVTGAEIPLGQSVTGWGLARGKIAFSEDGSLLFFGSADDIYIGSTLRQGIAVFNTADLTLNSKSLAVSNGVSKQIAGLEVYGNTLYVGGYFTSMGANNQPRNYLAAIDIASGNATGWNPNPDREIRGIYKNGTDLYVYGSFTKIFGQNRDGFAVIDLTDGSLKPLQAPFSGYSVKSISSGDGALYIGANQLYKLSLSDQTFSEIQTGGCQYSSVSNNRLYAYPCGYRFIESAIEATQGLSILNLQTRQWTPLTLDIPEGGQITNVLRVSDSRIAILGLFTETDPLSGEDVNYGVLVVDLLTKEVKKVKVDGDVLGGTILNDVLYISGGFSEVEGEAQDWLAAVDLNDLSLKDWAPVLAPGGGDPFKVTSIAMVASYKNQIYVAYNVDVDLMNYDDIPVGRVQRFSPDSAGSDGWILSFERSLEDDKTKLVNGLFSTAGEFTTYQGTPVFGGMFILDFNNSEKHLADIAAIDAREAGTFLSADDATIWYTYYDDTLDKSRVETFSRTAMKKESAGDYLTNLASQTWVTGVQEYNGFIYVSGDVMDSKGAMSNIRVLRKSDGAIRY